MPYYIGRKLDFLMNLTGAKNSALAHALNFDTSHISRIRINERGLPRRRSFIEPAADYFARRIKEPYQVKAAADAICPGQPWPTRQEDAAVLIAAWLAVGSGESPNRRNEDADSAAPRGRRGKSAYLGTAGKREAVARFFTDVLSEATVSPLLLYSNEDMEWLFGDTAFARRWMEWMTVYLRRGGKLKIVHSLGRNIGEMLLAVQKWSPLYLIGDVDPYYCPKIRDGIFHQTRFIAQGCAAVISSSVDGKSEGMCNLYIDDQEAVGALEGEFTNFLSLCRPLMTVYRADSAKRLFWTVAQFEDAAGPLLLIHGVPSWFTQPEEVTASLASRAGGDWLLTRTAEARGRFARHLASRQNVTELLHLPDLAAVKAGKLLVPLGDLFGAPELAYTPAELAAHLRAMITQMRKFPTYRVILTDHLPPSPIMLCKESVGAIILPDAPPSTVFHIQEEAMTASIWAYLTRAADQESRDPVKALEPYIAALEKA